jgi:hypothetical protein
MNRKKLFLILVIVLNLVPLAAFGKPAVKSRGKDAKQVTTLQAEDPARTIYENSMTFTEAEDTFFFVPRGKVWQRSSKQGRSQGTLI